MRLPGKATITDEKGNVLWEVDTNHHREYYRAIMTAMQVSAKKNHDYSGGFDTDPLSNFKRVEAAGIDPTMGLFVRMLDKVGRLETFFKTGELKVENEGAKDALMDLGNYCFLMIALMEDKKNE